MKTSTQLPTAPAQTPQKAKKPKGGVLGLAEEIRVAAAGQQHEPQTTQPMAPTMEMPTISFGVVGGAGPRRQQARRAPGQTSLTLAIEQASTRPYRISVDISAEFLRKAGAAVKPHNHLRDPQPTELVTFAMMVTQEILTQMEPASIRHLWVATCAAKLERASARRLAMLKAGAGDEA